VILRFVAEGSESAEVLRDGSVDLDIGAGDHGTPDIRTTVLYRERMVGIVRADSPLGRQRPPTLWQLCQHPTSRPPAADARAGRSTTRSPRRDWSATWPRSSPTAAVAVLLVASSRYVGSRPRGG
jgi:DNA-binding transcriptional LysR family regulator